MHSEVSRTPEKLITNTSYEHNRLNLLTIADEILSQPNMMKGKAEDLLPVLILGTTDAVLQSTQSESGASHRQYFNPLGTLQHNFMRQDSSMNQYSFMRQLRESPPNPYQFLKSGIRQTSLAARHDFLRTPQALPLATGLDGFFNPNYLADFTPAAPQLWESFQATPAFDYTGNLGNGDGQDFFGQLSSTIGGIFDWAVRHPETIVSLIKTVGTIAAMLAL
ncbi:MAG: hypothetical protein HY711_02505 [Candidatus Melainabacteria bacterium]|nr:hypothetical protein [Candidatus Melainabacteria bacterium]